MKCLANLKPRDLFWIRWRMRHYRFLNIFNIWVQYIYKNMSAKRTFPLVLHVLTRISIELNCVSISRQWPFFYHPVFNSSITWNFSTEISLMNNKTCDSTNKERPSQLDRKKWALLTNGYRSYKKGYTERGSWINNLPTK